MKLGNKKHVLVLSVAAVASWGYVFFGDSEGHRQRRWMAESEATLPRIRSVLDSDPWFASVYAAVSTSCDVVIVGRVRAEQDLRDLPVLLASLEFPHGVIWRAEVE